MKNHKAIIFWALCLFFVNLKAQDSTNIVSPLDTLRPDVVEEIFPKPVEFPSAELETYRIVMRTKDGNPALVFTSTGKAIYGMDTLIVNGEEVPLFFNQGQAEFPFDTDGKGELVLVAKNKKYKSYGDYSMYHVSKKKKGQYRIVGIPLWLSIVPPLVAILLALIFREVVISLFAGVATGAFIIGGMRVDSLYWIVANFFESLTHFVVGTLSDPDHMAVIIFSLLIGGMVALISRNGGMAGVVQSLSGYARSPKSTQFITWLLGVAIFFDDYANTLIVGNTMRSVTDKFKISREKLAYIVDSTAAPVSAVAFITTWIGAELGYIESGVMQLENFEYAGMSAYSIFLASLKYSFYPILTLVFILMVIYSGKDFGPMLKAERRARKTGMVAARRGKETSEADMEDLNPVKGAPLKWYNAFIPVSAVVLMTLFGLMDTGMTESYSSLESRGAEMTSMGWGSTWNNLGILGLAEVESEIYFSDDESKLSGEALSFLDGSSLASAKNTVAQTLAGVGFSQKLGILVGNANSYTALLWASLTGVVLALLLTLIGRIMNLEDSMNTLITGFKTMLPAIFILALAWALADITGDIHTKDFLTSALTGKLNPYLLPVIVFVLAAVISFSTGSSWSTMAILYPIAIPATWELCMAVGIEPAVAFELLLNVIAIVLAASVLGDHCSPISDTTILSSLASDCNHIDHVRTQLPYALSVGSMSLLCGGLSTLLGGGLLISVLLSAASLVVLWIVLNRFGQRAED